MHHSALVFLVVAVAAGYVGFGLLDGAAALIAKKICLLLLLVGGALSFLTKQQKP